MRQWSSSSADRLVFTALEPTAHADGTVLLDFRITSLDHEEVLEFTERIVLPTAPNVLNPVPVPADVLRLLSLAASLSYYKALVPATFSVPAGLTARERHFLSEVIANGLGEFAYRNQVPAALRPTIEAPVLPDAVLAGPSLPPEEPVRPLVAVGGGKDSIVTIESLREMGVDITLFSVNSYEPIEATATEAELPLLVARRSLDTQLFELNDAGALNGHVPVTAVNSLVGTLIAIRNGFDAVVFSNEGSSSFGNVAWEGIEVNHQWSKGFGFERLLTDALAGHPVRYFSFLRPLTELAIMRHFARLEDYHPVFTSCNRSFHLDASKRRRWCGECPKCHFVFLCLAPFLARDDLQAIFGGRDLLADPAQREGFLELLNVGGRLKPFECVGEPDECRAALTLLSHHEDWDSHPFFALPEMAECFLDPSQVREAFGFSDEHLLPVSYEKACRAVL
jgi:UDP-N-acetyl-alpha-D-muramoyl-L-alanyl-L-glutamate epimerase